jgi:hypothetical protein
MIPGMITRHTRIMGKNQEEYKSLAIRDETIEFDPPLGRAPVMRSAWIPTPAELRRLKAGEPVILSILGTSWPPVMLHVGDE